MKVLKFIAIGVLAWIGISLVLGLVFKVIGLITLAFQIAVPVALVGGIVYVIYKLSGGDKAIGSSQRRLP